MQAGRADWSCACPDYAHGSPYKAEDVPTQPHPNCHPAGTMIVTPDGDKPIQDIKPNDIVVSHDGSLQRVIYSHKYFHDGDILDVSTKDGLLSMTPDHPVLSDGRWVQAHTLKNGLNITSISVDIKTLSLIEPVSNNCPSKGLKESSLFRILHFLLGGCVPITAIDFNGQLYISKSEINIISSDIEIWDRLFPNSKEGFKHHALINRPSITGVELSYLGLLFIRVGDTPLGIMCGSSVSDPSSSIASIVALRNIWRSYTNTNKVPSNTTSGEVEPFSYLVDREILIPEELCQDTFVNVYNVTHNTNIVDVTCRKYKGTVYNLSVNNSNSFIANGFASHNCGCYVQARLMDNDTFVDDLKRWQNGESVEYLDDWKGEYYD